MGTIPSEPEQGTVLVESQGRCGNGTLLGADNVYIAPRHILFPTSTTLPFESYFHSVSFFVQMIK